jgi:hypothetical protein
MLRELQVLKMGFDAHGQDLPCQPWRVRRAAAGPQGPYSGLRGNPHHSQGRSLPRVGNKLPTLGGKQGQTTGAIGLMKLTPEQWGQVATAYRDLIEAMASGLDPHTHLDDKVRDAIAQGLEGCEQAAMEMKAETEQRAAQPLILQTEEEARQFRESLQINAAEIPFGTVAEAALQKVQSHAISPSEGPVCTCPFPDPLPILHPSQKLMDRGYSHLCQKCLLPWR